MFVTECDTNITTSGHVKMNVPFVDNTGHLDNDSDLAGSECLGGMKAVR